MVTFLKYYEIDTSNLDSYMTFSKRKMSPFPTITTI
jgi:hypothetical protein